MDIIPSDLATYGKDAKALLQELQSQNERMFMITILLMNTGRTPQELETNYFQASSIAQKYNCNLRRLDFQQENALMSSLPLAHNLIGIERQMTSSATGIMIPFTTQELFQNGKEALYYGLNTISNNLIMVDRKLLKNPKGLYHKGTGIPRKTQANVSFAAQMDRRLKKPQAKKKVRKDYENSSVLPPVFLLLVRGHFPDRQLPDRPFRKQERNFALSYTSHFQNSMRKGEAA